MMSFDTDASANLPALVPLANSYAQDDFEDELRQITLDLFASMLASQAHDVNVMGAAHLGSLDSIRKSVTWDGLALIPALDEDAEEWILRYLYRAWQARDYGGRGTYFLETFLQLLYPNLCQVAQMWQKNDVEYPLGLASALDEPDVVIDPERYWLTSRVEIGLDLSVRTQNITTLMEVISAILPARLVPHFRFRLIIDVTLSYAVEFSMKMTKTSEARWSYTDLIVTEREDAWFLLGDDDNEADAPVLGMASLTFECNGEVLE